MAIYLDNAAAVPCDPGLLERFAAYAHDFPGNQESMGFEGSRAARRIRETGSDLMDCLGFPSCTPIYGNTGTEVLALAAETACRAVSKGQVISTVLEHPALEYALKRSCALHGLRLEWCPADRRGVRMDVLESMLSADTVIVAVHQVQSETGGILDLAALRALLDRTAPQAILLVDTMQSFGKIPMDFRVVRPDFITFSGQKLGAPGGGILFCRNLYAKTAQSLRTVEHFATRCPTALLLTALQCGIQAVRGRQENYAQALCLKRLLLEELRKNGLNFLPTLSGEAVSPFIVHLLTVPYQGAILTRALHPCGISVAPGSACESETPGGSRVLSAMGYSRKESFCGLRISFWKNNTPGEIRQFAAKLAEVVKNY
ncbi:MAG: aminotransferase class V-fold PLP-dependent enzyme [Lentisphaeria bacterium]|nr:aminotransferase class V-fold PLP-dependent enzyme [Lentisphaeria bacterium]